MDEELNPYRTPSAVGDVENEACADGTPVKIQSVLLRAYVTVGFIGLSVLVKAAIVLGRACHFEWFLLRPGGGSLAPIEIAAELGIPLAVLYFFCFMMWTYRSARNARLLEGRMSAISPGMAVGAYFIPFYNWVGPFLAMKGVAQVIQRFSKGPEVWLGVWWAAWLFGGIVGVAHRISQSLESLYVLEVTSALAQILTAALVIRLTRQQSFLYNNPPLIPNRLRMVAGLKPPSLSQGIPLRPPGFPSARQPLPRQARVVPASEGTGIGDE